MPSWKYNNKTSKHPNIDEKWPQVKKQRVPYYFNRFRVWDKSWKNGCRYFKIRIAKQPNNRSLAWSKRQLNWNTTSTTWSLHTISQRSPSRKFNFRTISFSSSFLLISENLKVPFLCLNICRNASVKFTWNYFFPHLIGISLIFINIHTIYSEEIMIFH